VVGDGVTTDLLSVVDETGRRESALCCCRLTNLLSSSSSSEIMVHRFEPPSYTAFSSRMSVCPGAGGTTFDTDGRIEAGMAISVAPRVGVGAAACVTETREATARKMEDHCNLGRWNRCGAEVAGDAAKASEADIVTSVLVESL
jgi:hypothetical protein